MIENIETLTNEDKLFMIYNKHSFSIPTISTISSNEDKWKEDIKIHVSPDTIHAIESGSKVIYSRNPFSNIRNFSNTENTNIINIIENNIYNISIMPCETKENITDIIYILNSLITKLNNIPNTDTSLEKTDVCNYFIKNLLPWKLRAHEILVKTKLDCAPNDSVLRDYYLKTLRCILKQLPIQNQTIDVLSLLIYQILNYLNIKDNENLINALVTISSYTTGLDINEVNKKVNELIKEDSNSLNLIKSITSNNVPQLDTIISNARKSIEENYEKNKISDKLSNRGVVIGDDVFDNGGISLVSLVRELEELNEERLKDYVGECKMTSFEIPENDIGYLKLREKLPICKVMTKGSSFYTLTRYDDKSYLLFKIYGDNKCYGISFPSAYGGYRKIVMFEPPNEYNYMMSL